MSDIPLAPWRSPLARALHRNRSLVYARYVQLATVRSDGRPANRTVVFRGFLELTNQLKFIADTRSQKIDQIWVQPWGEVCWYFPKTREQFRLLGTLEAVAAEHPNHALLQARRNLWRELSDAARVQFAWAEPGIARSETVASETVAIEISPPDAAEPLPNFCLLLLNPTQVDHLELRGDPQNRYFYSKDSEAGREAWAVQTINP